MTVPSIGPAKIAFRGTIPMAVEPEELPSQADHQRRPNSIPLNPLTPFFDYGFIRTPDKSHSMDRGKSFSFRIDNHNKYLIP